MTDKLKEMKLEFEVFKEKAEDGFVSPHELDSLFNRLEDLIHKYPDIDGIDEFDDELSTFIMNLYEQ